MPTDRVLRWDVAQKFADNSPWTKACLTWDEMNANSEGNVKRDPFERWEGVIAHSSKHFPQIGGPPCSGLNKRNEVAIDGVKSLRLYYDPTDRRLHLKGANEGWLHVDFDLDGIGGESDKMLRVSELARDGPYTAKYLALRASQGQLPALKRGGRWWTSRRAVGLYRRDVGKD